MRTVLLVGGAVASGALTVLALWAWQNAAEVAGDAAPARPYVATLAVRSAAIAAAAAAQAVLLVVVVGRIYGRTGVLEDVLRLSTVLVFVVALVSAVALGLAGR